MNGFTQAITDKEGHLQVVQDLEEGNR